MHFHQNVVKPQFKLVTLLFKNSKIAQKSQTKSTLYFSTKELILKKYNSRIVLWSTNILNLNHKESI